MGNRKSKKMKVNNTIINADSENGAEQNLELGLYLIKEVFEKEINESKTKFITGAVRSGNKITYEGSIVIIGDVNAGAEIITGENIIVLGELRGVAHAGAMGNKMAIIAALNIVAPQLRIANILWENEGTITDSGFIKRYAYVENNEIKIISNKKINDEK